MKQLIIAITMLASNASGCAVMWDNTLTGRVTDSMSKPIEGVTVSLEDSNSRGPKANTKTATTDSTGVYFIEVECSGFFPNGGYCPRSFNITAAKEGYPEFRAEISNTQEIKVYDIKIQ